MIDFGEGKVATLHPGCIEMPSDLSHAHCQHKLSQGGGQGRPGGGGGLPHRSVLPSDWSSVLLLVIVYFTGSYSSSEFVVIPDNSTLVTCLHQAACKVNVIVPLSEAKMTLTLLRVTAPWSRC